MDQVSVDYPSRPGIIRNVSLHLPAGSFCFVAGPSGAGKTTLLKLMFLGMRPTAGTVEVFGRDVASLSRDQRAYVRSRLGVVFQDFRLIEHMSIYDNVALPLRLAGKDSKGNRDYVRELLDWVGLGDHAQSKPEQLSGGQKQRAAIARAVINRPAVLLADEPTGNVDDGIGLKLLRLFEELNKLGTTVVVATHSESLLQRFEYPTLRLKQGQLVNHASAVGAVTEQERGAS